MSAPATGQSATLDTADHDGVLVVALDRPPANAMNRRLIHDLAGLFEQLRARPDAPPIVLTGKGERFFSGGGDIKELEGALAGEIEIRMREFHALLVAMDRYPRPVVSAINGHCVGGGMEVALFSDSVLAVNSARFGFPEINHGLLPADKESNEPTGCSGCASPGESSCRVSFSTRSTLSTSASIDRTRLRSQGADPRGRRDGAAPPARRLRCSMVP